MSPLLLWPGPVALPGLYDQNSWLNVMTVFYEICRTHTWDELFCYREIGHALIWTTAGGGNQSTWRKPLLYGKHTMELSHICNSFYRGVCLNLRVSPSPYSAHGPAGQRASAIIGPCRSIRSRRLSEAGTQAHLTPSAVYLKLLGLHSRLHVAT